MHHLSIVSSFLLASRVIAIQSTKILAARASPSSYPGGDGDACTNEFKYLNFDSSDGTQKSHAQAAHRAFCIGWLDLTVSGAQNVDDTDRAVFQRFFKDTDNSKTKVGQVYSALVNKTSFVAQPIIADMILDNNDFLDVCDGDGKASTVTGAYWGIDTADNLEKFHICDAAYKFPDVPSDMYCGYLSGHPSIAMESLASIILHETLHFTSVGTPIFNRRIRDKKNKDGIGAYCPQRTHGLVDPRQDNANGKSAKLANTNADSYAWHATNSYYKYACSNVGEPGPNNGNYNDPPAYTRGQGCDANSDVIGMWRVLMLAVADQRNLDDLDTCRISIHSNNVSI
ncbi:hypothetical protein KJ359_008351 [Pestalotiopsis sp. 9143b]|nr:hypothetical protein KJ359_008351 [Pestalotiopsis sp. 9143b]